MASSSLRSGSSGGILSPPDFRALPQWSADSLFQLPERRLVIGAGLVVRADRLVVAALGVEQFQKAGRALLVAERGYGFQSARPFDRGCAIDVQDSPRRLISEISLLDVGHSLQLGLARQRDGGLLLGCGLRDRGVAFVVNEKRERNVDAEGVVRAYALIEPADQDVARALRPGQRHGSIRGSV